MPKVSVIIPVYGVEKYIERCARSLFEQTLDNIEFIFIDDCTPDSSIKILNQIVEEYRLRFAEKNHVLRIERMLTNSGLTAVRKHGIQLATGDYIIHCDSDDWVEVTAYEKMYKKAVKDACDIIVCDYYLSDGENHKEKKHLPSFIYSDKVLYFSKLLRGDASTSVWTKMVRRELYKNNSLIFPVCNMWEDYVFSVQLISHSSKIGYVDECLYYYYFNPSSICNSNIDRNQQQIMKNAGIILAFLGSLKVSSNDIICFKQNARYELSKHVGVYKYWRMWHNTFPEIKMKYIFINDVNFRERMRFLSIYIGLYPLVLRILSISRKLIAN